jgi:ABC-2 type transport system permease protein/capsular polysaccharide transport system permease protein
MPEPVAQIGLARAFAIQRRVVAALLMREILTRFGRHNIGFLWLFVEPMLFTLGVTTLWTMTRAVHGSDLPIVPFAITGYSTVLLWRNMPNRCVGSILPNLALMYHRNVRVMDIFAARLLLEGGGATISFVALTLIFSFIGWCRLPEDILTIVGGWLMIAWFGASLFCWARCQKNMSSSKSSGILPLICCFRFRAPASLSTACRSRRRRSFSGCPW